MMSSIALILYLAVFCWASYKKTIWGVVMVILLLPSYLYRFEILSLPTTFLELLILCLFVIWLIKCRQHKCKQLRKYPNFLKVLLSLWIIASLAAVVINPTLAALGIWRAYFLEPMIFFIIVTNSIRSKKDMLMVIYAMALLVTWLFVVALYQNYTHWNYLPAYNFPNTKRLTSIFLYPNALTLLTAPIVAFFAGLWFKSKDKLVNWPYLLIVGIGLLMAWLARSEGAVFAIVGSLILILILEIKNIKLGIPLAIVAVIFVLLFSSLPSVVSGWKQQLCDPVLDLQATSLEIRSSQWSETWHMLREHTWWGAGLMGYQSAMTDYHQVDWLEIYLYPHNVFLNFWSELGLMGLIVFVALLIYILVIVIRLFIAKNNMALPILLMWFTWFVHGLVDVPYFKNDLSILFFVMLAITILARDKKLRLHKC